MKSTTNPEANTVKAQVTTYIKTSPQGGFDILVTRWGIGEPTRRYHCRTLAGARRFELAQHTV